MSKEVDNKVRIFVWADGTWCYATQIEDYSWKSDDYASVRCELGSEEEAVAAFMGA